MADIFVFDSDLSGIHGKGAALFAVQNHGAIRGIGWGIQGNSYAIPTKGFMVGKRLPVLPLPLIHHFVLAFLDYARKHPQDRFKVTPIGCGLAGYKPPQIAPMFDYCPTNVGLPYEFIF